MKESNVDTQRLVESMAEEAVTSLFEAYGVRLVSVPTLSAPSHKVLLSGVIGFTGPGIRGTCILAATEKPIHASNPIEGSLRDWIAELSNQLVGRIKNKLLTYGAEVYITTPVVLRGEHLAPLPRHELEPLAFATEGGSVFVWIELETAPEFVLEPLPEPAGISEGDALLF